ncbi:hypothetical protein HYPP_00833 [Hyphomicrobium sp. ghe19]|nr:hypothetical protein HYPP_00833 [Hyphomicrobium sp. ghe19]
MQAAPRTSEESGSANGRSKAEEAQRESPHSFVKNLLQRGRITEYGRIYTALPKLLLAISFRTGPERQK